MREAMKRLTGESLIYGLGQVGGRAVQLLLVPVLTRTLSQGAFGVAELVAAYMQTGALVLVFGMDAALARFFYQEPDRAARVRMVSTSFLFRATITLAACGLVALFAAPLADRLLGAPAYRKYLLLGAATLPFTLTVMFANDVLRVTFQPWKFIALNLVNTFLVGGLSLWLVIARHAGVVGVLYGRLAGDALTALLGLVLIRHALRPAFDRATLRRMMAFGLPLVPAAIAYGAVASIDRYVLQSHRGIDEVAVYGVAAKFFAIVTMGVSAFQLAYMPFAYARARSEDAPRLFARAFALYLSVGSLGAMAIGLFAPEVLVLIAPPSYAGAALPAVLLAFAAVAQGAYTVAGIGLNLALRTSLVAWIAGGASLVAVVANFALTPRFGPPGAALATWLAHVTAAVLAYVLAQRVYPLPYRGMRGAVLVASGLAITVSAQRLAPPGAAGIALKAAALAAFAGLAWASGMWRDRGGVSHRSVPLPVVPGVS